MKRRPLPAADRRLLPEGWLSGPMPWVIAIMMFLTVLAAAGGLGLRAAAAGLGDDLAGRITVQIVQADAVSRATQAQRALAAVGRLPGLRSAEPVSRAAMGALLEPWLGPEGLGEDLPLPALIDVTFADDAIDHAPAVAAALRGVAPDARVDDHARSLAPLTGLIDALKWLALALVLLMAAATASAVVLAARSALNTHRATIDVMHLLGSTDVQIARLFQRRIALDALFGGLIGLVCGLVVLMLIGHRMGQLGSELLGTAALPAGSWLLLALLPLAGTLLAMLTARLTVLSALRRIL
ncbi:cell division protein FtsX [Sphingomonas profundi]|uniref:cell division protein FtsX n=1 Tax=Alterirhizorhabdus profundi TaxID=2681549 RepID=UPI0018D1C02A|nr:cell division protein [Sphingomonas profundi]